MWKCPECERTFKNTNQSHSCVSVSEEDIMQKTGDHVKVIYYKLSKELAKFGEMQVNQASSTIFYKNGATFLAVKPKKAALYIEFLLPVEVHEFPVSKAFKMSKNRVAHTVVLDEPAQIDKQLIGWLKEAYETVSSG